MNILIVDDSKFLRTILKNMLLNLGFPRTYEAVNGMEAVRKAHIIHPDLIFMNLIMPEMDGYDASKEILQFYPAKIVIMSSNKMSDTPFGKSKVNIYDYVSIPFSTKRIMKILDSVE